MIFGDKKNSKRTAQLKSVLEDAVDEALKRQARELARQQEGQNAYLSEGIEKNQKAISSRWSCSSNGPWDRNMKWVMPAKRHGSSSSPC